MTQIWKSEKRNAFWSKIIDTRICNAAHSDGAEAQRHSKRMKRFYASSQGKKTWSFNESCSWYRASASTKSTTLHIRVTPILLPSPVLSSLKSDILLGKLLRGWNKLQRSLPRQCFSASFDWPVFVQKTYARSRVSSLSLVPIGIGREGKDLCQTSSHSPPVGPASRRRRGGL